MMKEKKLLCFLEIYKTSSIFYFVSIKEYKKREKKQQKKLFLCFNN